LMVVRAIQLGNRKIGPAEPVLVIAEAGVNHNGDMGLARKLIEAAAAAGADVIKFQSFETEEIIVPQAPKAGYQMAGGGAAESQYQMLKALELSGEQQAELMACCRQAGIMFLSTPYDSRSVELLKSLGAPGYKIASTDTTNLPVLEYVARQGLPVLLSTGMCDMAEVAEAVGALGDTPLALLHCTSEYPAPVEESNLGVIAGLAARFECPVGFSDHTRGMEVAGWAVAAGACIIEKHLTLDRALPGPDHAASVEPGELAELVRLVRRVEAARGDGHKRAMPSELRNKPVMQKSLVARKPLAAGEVIAADSITCKRPGTGLQPRLWAEVVGRKAARAIAADEVITRECVIWE
jgi:N,N'-diacetyllegionaminate synthase